ncbi:MAG: VOC family protein [Candidatus Eremiobacteraeota bacterium]|nr:VOC family protein [Candidatus Eremiobacteraeota bacterium]MBV8221732.1 VOC family protein [Candidatus Eremiobacteraeota bacterium]
MSHDTTAIAGIDVTMYLVQDFDRAMKFWTETMGLTPTFHYPIGRGAEFTLADGSTFGLYQRPDGEWARSAGVMFAVPDIDAAVKKYKALGVKFGHGGEIREGPICWLAFAQDSEGNFFALHQRKAQDQA